MKVLRTISITLGAILVSGQALAIQNCLVSNGNVDITTRKIDVRSAPGTAGSDFRAVEKAMRSGGNGRLVGVCIEGHSNIPNSITSTQAEAKRFGLKMRQSGLAKGVPITISGYGNTRPVTDKPAEFVNAKGERVQIRLTPSNIQRAILNYRLEVHYVYACPIGVPCVAPFSGLAAGPLISGATLTAPGAAAAAVAPVGLLSGGALAGGALAAAAIAAAIGGGGSGGGTTGTTN